MLHKSNSWMNLMGSRKEHVQAPSRQTSVSSAARRTIRRTLDLHVLDDDQDAQCGLTAALFPASGQRNAHEKEDPDNRFKEFLAQLSEAGENLVTQYRQLKVENATLKEKTKDSFESFACGTQSLGGVSLKGLRRSAASQEERSSRKSRLRFSMAESAVHYNDATVPMLASASTDIRRSAGFKGESPRGLKTAEYNPVGDDADDDGMEDAEVVETADSPAHSDTEAEHSIFPEWDLEVRDDSDVARGMEYDIEIETDPGVLSPLGWARICWDVISMAGVFFVFWSTPFELVFLPEATQEETMDLHRKLSIAITAFFTCDILLNFNTGYVDPETDDLVMKRATICQNYLKGWFWLDLAGTIPFDVLLKFMVSDATQDMLPIAKIFRASRLLRFLRILRLVRAPRLMQSIQRNFEAVVILRRLVRPGLYALFLVCLTHIHACVFGLVIPISPALATGDRYRLYLTYFSEIYLAFTFGVKLDIATPEGDALNIIVASERCLLVSAFGMLLVAKALFDFEARQRHEMMKDDALDYLRRRKIKYSVQSQVLQQLNETSRAQIMKRRFDMCLESDIPKELRRIICDELWCTRLRSICLIDAIAGWDREFVSNLAVLVREETIAAKSTIFSEGDLSNAAYCIVQGRVRIHSTKLPRGQTIPDFITGMWVGEKSLVSPLLSRTVSAFTRSTSTLLAVPAEDFHNLILRSGLRKKYETFCKENIWQGICGRCGLLDGHFADACPLLGRRPARLPRFDRARTCCFPSRHDAESALPAPTLDPVPPHFDDSSQGKISSTSNKSSGKRSLRIADYAKKHQVEALEMILQEKNIHTIADLESLSADELENLVSQVAADQRFREANAGMDGDQLRQILSLGMVAEFKKLQIEKIQRRFNLLGSRDQHLLFLSHYKMEAGTEATLMRTELEALILTHPTLKKLIFDQPVFLDSDNLDDLEDLQGHVTRSQNLALLLTRGVLARPWVIVEIATAIRNGVQILPVKVQKVGHEFTYPTDEFYQSVKDGTFIDKGGLEILSGCEVTLDEVEMSIRRVFKRIALPFSPHGSEATRRTELLKLLNNCQVFGEDQDRGERDSIMKAQQRTEEAPMMEKTFTEKSTMFTRQLSSY